MKIGTTNRAPTGEDKDLLGLAIKAAGLTLRWSAVDGFSEYGGIKPWNPLEDDGDALRLANLLNIPIEGTEAVNGDNTVFCGYVDAGGCREEYRGNVASRHSATRRAIVRAAAEIGKQQ